MPPARRESRLSAFGAPAPAPAPAAAPAPAPAPAPKPADPAEAARGVAEVVALVNRTLQSDPVLADVWVRGEMSGITFHSSGHWYFTLKDAGAVLNGVMFRGANARVRFRPEEGLEVLARGRVAVYAGTSRLQIVVEELRPVGVGELALRFEQLKRRLEAEGLFAPQRKRALPPYPQRVGIVTSLQAAALRDMVRVATARFPGVQLVVAHARVQGEGAADEIAAALERLDRDGRCDVLIVGRGGGSIEDLWAFNEERVVRAVASCRTPVVSAVGHETDFTLCDFAADLRAATPSNACEIVVPDAGALLAQLADSDDRMRAALGRLVPEMRQRLDDLVGRAEGAVLLTIDRERELLAAKAERLEALSPLGVLARGYSVARAKGRVVRSVDDVAPGEDVELVLRDGRVEARVASTRKEEPS